MTLEERVGGMQKREAGAEGPDEAEPTGSRDDQGADLQHKVERAEEAARSIALKEGDS